MDGSGETPQHNELHGNVNNAAMGRDFYGAISLVTHHHYGAPGVAERMEAGWWVPPQTHRFVNYERQWARLSEYAAGRETALIVLQGLPGIGKTELLAHWARRAKADRLFDASLYIEVGDAGSSKDRSGPADALHQALLQAGMPARDVPPSYGTRLAAFRRWVREQKILVLVDGIDTVQYLDALSPIRSGSVLVATTYLNLAVAARARHAEIVEMGPLDDEHARELLATIVGEQRLSAEPEATRELIALCGGLPLAICVEAAELRAKPGRTVARQVRRVRRSDQLEGPGVKGDDELSISAKFDRVYGGFDEGTQRFYRLLGQHPRDGAVVTVQQAAMLAGVAEDDAEDALDDLVEAGLMLQTDGRFAFVSRVHRHASATGQREEFRADSDAALRRLLEWYLRHAVAADLTLNPYRNRFGPLYAELREQPSPFGAPPEGEQAALDWLATERRSLSACVFAAEQREWPELVVQLCEATWSLHFNLKTFDDGIATTRRGLAVAAGFDEPQRHDWIFQMGVQLGRCYFEQGEFAQAGTVLDQALDAARSSGRQLSEITALESIGRARLEAGEFEKAIATLTEGAGICVDVEPRPTHTLAVLSLHLGRAYAGLPDYRTAFGHLDTAEELFRGAGDRYNEARVMISRGEALIASGHPGEAIAPLTEAQDVMAEKGRTFQRAKTAELLGAATRDIGDMVAARDHLNDAVTLYAALGRPEAETVGAALATLPAAAESS